MAHRFSVVFQLRSTVGDPPPNDPSAIRRRREAERLEAQGFLSEVTRSGGPGPFPPAVRPLITSVDVVELVDVFRGVARARPGRPWPALERYFQVHAPSRIDAEILVTTLRGWDRVERAYIKCPAGPAAGLDDAESENPINHLAAWPVGVGALAVAQVDGADGMHDLDGLRVRLAALEFGWRASPAKPVDYQDNHDLATAMLEVVYGEPFTEDAVHGTKVLGVLVAQADGTGARGIVPECHVLLLAASKVRSDISDGTTEADTLAHLIVSTSLPAVLLLAIQLDPSGNPRPIEVEKPTRDLIDGFAALGTVVVEASADANGDLAELEEAADLFEAAPEAGQFSDPAQRSDALMVAGGIRTGNHWWHDGASRYGTRVDCFAHSKDVFTDSFKAQLDDLVAVAGPSFSQSSAASAIIAGVVASIQGMALARFGRTLTAAEVRVLLQKWGRRTVGRPIGVLPDLERLAWRFTLPETKEKYAVITPPYGIEIDSLRVYFGSDSTSVLPGDDVPASVAELMLRNQEALDCVAELIKQHEDVRFVRVQGHADVTPGPGQDYNQKLSQERIKSVVAALHSRGVSLSRLGSEAFADKMPITTVTSAEEGTDEEFELANAFNRRVEFEVVRWKVPPT